MSDTVGDDEIVTIDGRQYSRLMAEQVALDIELVHATKPGAWTIGDSSALVVGNVAFLSFALPLRHGYLIDTTNATEAVRTIAETYGRGSPIPTQPTLVKLELPEKGREHLLRDLRKAHESAIMSNMDFFSKTQRWKWHNFEVAQILSTIVGRPLPQPDYAEELVSLRSQSANPQAIVPVQRYWKISPGGAGKFWSEFRDRSLIAMHWSDTQVDLSGFPESRTEFFTRAKLEMGVSDQGAKSLWDLSRVMKIGDEVLAYANQTVLAHGVVTGDYQFVEDEFEFPHRRSVTWTSLDPLPISTLPVPLQTKLKTQATLFELTEDQFMLATRQQDSPPLGEISPLDLVLEQFAASGLHYSRSQVATFYTALQTKGFVVLSGISGTGKSRIATGFVEMLPMPVATVIKEWHDDGVIPIVVIPDMKKNRRYTIPGRYHELFPPMEIGTRYQLDATINGKLGTGRLWYRMHQGRESLLLTFHQNLAPEINQWNEGQHIYLVPVHDSEGDKLSEIRITNDAPVSDNTEPEPVGSVPEAQNHLFLSVRPDWRDSTSLLGYYNPLTQTYEWTEFLRFIIRAQESYQANDGLAWFVILDEMNLAHVEYYFADLLSVIESGRDLDGWTREPIRLTYPDTLDDEVPPREIKLPPNLYIIGTVNMDETTHAFSPKVLDRAFTIELTDVDFLNYKLDITPGTTQLDDTAKRRLLDHFTRRDPATGRPRFAQINKAEIAEIVEHEPSIRVYLDSLNRQLQHHRFHFGYRVFDEIAQYLYNNAANEMTPYHDAFDQAVLMKVLPKFTGSLARLRAPLLSLLAWTFNPDNPGSIRQSIQQQFEALNPDDPAAVVTFTAKATFQAVANRATQMLLALETDGFVSFG